MYYEINVSKNGKHYFATAKRSLIDKEPALAVFNDVKARFPESEGFKVTLAKYETSGQYIA